MIAENAVKRVTDLEELMLKSDEYWFFDRLFLANKLLA